MSLTFVFKALSTIALFVVFFAVFGMFSIQKYIQGDIVTVTRTKPNDGGLSPPAIMVCPEGKFGGAWKENCYNLKDNLTKMDACSRKHSFTLNDTMLSTNIAKSNGARKRTFHQSLWTLTYTMLYLGTCHILKPGKRLLKSDEELNLLFPVNTSVKSFSIYLIDPNFFVMKKDNSVIPFLLLDNPMSKDFSLHTIHTSRMNRPEFACNPDKSYNYNRCVSTNLARKIGCKNPMMAPHRLEIFKAATQLENLSNIGMQIFVFILPINKTCKT